ncbi:IclR family transcriptional regulator [Ideonella livida]|uniref:IclR family transcriptional regulator n=1 Tax=Ideonella livida TaxID=2707176 RepID=A0A7C9PKE4_9BURK|nr:IclR family transcriptional regulator [Ideonella livida]NDY93232.1 IclR family transcriptional regulator [Ideonella livida]
MKAEDSTATPSGPDDDKRPDEGRATPDKGGIQVIARAAAVLRALKDHPAGLSLGELAKLLKLPRSTVQRIVDALDEENLVIAASPTRGVRLGPALLALAAATRFEIAEIARPTLQEISRLCGETVDLSVLDGDKLVFVDQIAGVHRLRAESAIGVSFTLHATAPGKAMLAALEPGALANLRPRLKLLRLTAHTLTAWPVLEAELARVRETGLGTDLEENSLGICALATALVLPGGEMAALSVPVPTQRFEAMRGQVSELLLSLGGRLQQQLNGR